MNKSNVWADLEKENTNVYKRRCKQHPPNLSYILQWGVTFGNQVDFNLPPGDGNDIRPFHLLTQIL